MKEFLCIGGPLDGQHAEREVALRNDYTQFNSGGKSYRITPWMRKRMIERGETIVIIPSMVWVHRSFFVLKTTLNKTDPDVKL
jgi:hypothetical protein